VVLNEMFALSLPDAFLLPRNPTVVVFMRKLPVPLSRLHLQALWTLSPFSRFAFTFRGFLSMSGYYFSLVSVQRSPQRVERGLLGYPHSVFR